MPTHPRGHIGPFAQGYRVGRERAKRPRQEARDLRAVDHGVVRAAALLHRLEPGVAGKWDYFRIDQVVTNLLTNAQKYSGPEAGIAVNVTRRGREMAVTVADQGPGIPDVEQALDDVEKAGQHDLSEPQIESSIRQTLNNEKEQLLKAAYIEDLRNRAKISNYLARQIAEAGGPPPEAK